MEREIEIKEVFSFKCLAVIIRGTLMHILVLASMWIPSIWASTCTPIPPVRERYLFLISQTLPAILQVNLGDIFWTNPYKYLCFKKNK